MKKLLLLALGALAGLFMVEVGARVSGLGRVFFQRDDAVGYWLTPDFSRVMTQFEDAAGAVTATTNNLGLRRDGDLPWEKPAGTRRVLVLGDSQTEGIVANADTYAAQLERMLAAGGGNKVEVLNAGVSGYSPLLEYLYLSQRGRRLEPDIIVLALYTGNDLGELTAREVDFGGQGTRIAIPTLVHGPTGWEVLRPGAPDTATEIDAWLQAELRTYALLRRKLRRGAEPVEVLGRAAESCVGCMQALWQQWLAQTRPDGYDQAALQLHEVLRRFKALAAELEARPLIVLLPTKLEVEAVAVHASVAEVQRILGLQVDPWVFAQTVRAQILAASAAEQLEVQDLLPELRRRHEENGRSLYWSLDWHLNPEGHTVVAEALKPRLAALLPH